MKQFEPHKPGSRMLFTLKAINDLNEAESGKVKISILDYKGKAIWSQEQEVQVAPYGEKNYPVVIDLPSEAGAYTLVTEFAGNLSPLKRQISRRYINVGTTNNKFFEVAY